LRPKYEEKIKPSSIATLNRTGLASSKISQGTATDSQQVYKGRARHL
jgi:hypothetical protein